MSMHDDTKDRSTDGPDQGGSCCGGHAAPPADEAKPQVTAEKPAKQPASKQPESRQTGGSCGCGH